VDLGFRNVSGEQCLWYRPPDDDGKGEILMGQLVDDHIVAGEEEVVKEMQEQLEKRGVPISVFKRVEFYDGIEFVRGADGSMTLTQRGYIEKCIKENGLQDMKGSRTPVDVSYNEEVGDNAFLDRKEHAKYRKMVGEAAFAANMTRPDISFAIHALSRHLHAPTQKHMKDLMRLFQYLKKFPDRGICYSREGSIEPVVYADASFGDPEIELKAVTGAVVIMMGGPVSWIAKKQPIQSHSTAEAEVIAACAAAKEAKYFRLLLDDIGITVKEPTVIWEDNSAAIVFAKAEGGPQRLRHLDLRRFAIREMVRNNIVRLEKVDGKLNVADMFTKGLPGPLFSFFRDSIMVDVKSA
jgi:hypothetical protein